jgi:hypothetical protein
VPPPRSKTAIFFFALLVEAVRQRCGRRFVDDAQHVQAGDASGVLGGLSLTVVEISRDCNNGVANRLAEKVLGVLLDISQDVGGYFGRAVLFAPDIDSHVTVGSAFDFVRQNLHVLLDFVRFEFASDQPLDAEDRVFRIGNRLSFCNLPDQPLSALGHGNDRGGCAPSFRVGDDFGIAPLHDRHARVGGAEIDTDDFTHFFYSSLALNIFLEMPTPLYGLGFADQLFMVFLCSSALPRRPWRVGATCHA